MTAEMTYGVMYLEINLMSLLLIGIIRYKTAGISKMVAQRNFAMAIDAEMFFFLSDTFYVMMKCGLLPYTKAAVIASKEIYFFSTTLTCFFWFVYYEFMQESAFVNSRKRVLISSVLVWVMVILLIVNIFTGILFYVDEDGVYRRGKLFIIQYLLSYIYVFVTCFRAFIGLFRKSMYQKRKTLNMLALFPLAPAGAGILQFVYPELPLACAALSIATLIMYLGWTDQMISIDPLTKLNNRKQLSYYYDQWADEPEEMPLYLMLIDADRFKGINDTYGHIQGDAALVRIADAMRLGCREIHRKANLARYGGDEFVILITSKDPDIVDDLKARIKRNLAELNSASGAPYELTVSIGSARAETSSTLEELISQADEKLYEEKRKTVK